MQTSSSCFEITRGVLSRTSLGGMPSKSLCLVEPMFDDGALTAQRQKGSHADGRRGQCQSQMFGGASLSKIIRCCPGWPETRLQIFALPPGVDDGPT